MTSTSSPPTTWTSPPKNGAASPPLHTPLCSVLNIAHPIMLAGMNAVATAELVAAVSNAGGIGTIGGLNMKPKQLREQIKEMKALLKPRADGTPPPFGVDLAIVQVGCHRSCQA